jgi:hypothetical protein
MIPFIATALLVAANTAAATGSCTGADPALVGASVKGVTNSGNINHYVVTVSVINRGNANQPSNVLQSVDVFQNGNKVDTKGIPPLKAGQGYKFDFHFMRSAGAPDGTTHFRFAIAMHQPSGAPNAQDCSTSNDTLIRAF